MKPISKLVIDATHTEHELLRIECFGRYINYGEPCAEIRFTDNRVGRICYDKDDLIKIARYLLNEANKL